MKPVRALLVVLALALLCPEPRLPALAQDEHHFVGRFLVATTNMADPRFQQSVIYIIGHGSDGAVGFMINRPIAEGPLADLLRAAGRDPASAEGNVTVFYGGPVDAQELFVLHSNDYASRATRFVGNGLGITSDADILSAIAGGKGPRQKLFLFGYAAWGPGQLEEEIESGAWFVIPGELPLIFNNEPEKTWQSALAKRKQKT